VGHARLLDDGDLNVRYGSRSDIVRGVSFEQQADISDVG